MYALANTTITVTRGAATNDYGDLVDADQPAAQTVAANVPALISITTSRPYDSAAQTVRVVQTVSAAVPSDLDLLVTDQLVDDTTGAVYGIETITPHPGPGLVGDLELALRRVV